MSRNSGIILSQSQAIGNGQRRKLPSAYQVPFPGVFCGPRFLQQHPLPEQPQSFFRRSSQAGFAKFQRLDIQLQQVTVDEIQAQAVIFRLQASFGHMDFALMRNEILGVDDVADDESEPYRDLTVRNAEV